MKVRMSAVIAPLALGLALAMSPAAQAVPVPSIQVSAPNDGLTSAQRKVAGYALKVQKAAVYHSHHHLDYAKAIKAVGGTRTKAKYRRQYAAGFWFSGGKLYHISHAERLLVKKYIPKTGPSTASANLISGPVMNSGGTNCTGVNKEVVYDNRDNGQGGRYIWVKSWYDSCRTRNIVWSMGSVALALGAIGYHYKPSEPVTYTLGALLGLGSGYIALQASNSNVAAVIITSKYGAYYVNPQ